MRPLTPATLRVPLGTPIHTSDLRPAIASPAAVSPDTAPARNPRAAPALRPPTRRRPAAIVWLFIAAALGLGIAFPGHALDLVNFTGITGPLSTALTTIASLGPAIKALIGFIGFVVALISLAALRNFAPVLFYLGLAIFAAVGLVAAGSIMGAVI